MAVFTCIIVKQYWSFVDINISFNKKICLSFISIHMHKITVEKHT